MPIADLKRDHMLVRFWWSYDKDIVIVHGHFGPVIPEKPVKNEKMKKTRAQQYWKLLVAVGFKHIGTYDDPLQVPK